MGCTISIMTMTNVELLSTEAASWSMALIRLKVIHWQRWGQHHVAFWFCSISSPAPSLYETPEELLHLLTVTLSVPFLQSQGCLDIWTDGSQNRGSWSSFVQWHLNLGVSWYYGGKSSEGGRTPDWPKAGILKAKFLFVGIQLQFPSFDH